MIHPAGATRRSRDRKETRVPLTSRNLILIGLATVLLSAVGCAPTANTRLLPRDPTPRLAVLSAFEPELEDLREEIEIETTRIINGRTYTIGRLAGNEVVMVLSGISMVNAAMTTQTMLDHFNVVGIVFSGIAGGVNPNLRIGDVVVPAQWGGYQEHVFARETDGGWDVGGRSMEFGNFGMMFPRRAFVVRRNGAPDEEERVFWFSADSVMLRIAGRAAQSARLRKCTPNGDCLEADPRVVIGGNGVSGPTFVDNAEYRSWVWDTFHADALDMESAAVAHVAYANAVPFIVFRSLSDLAGGGPGENQVDTFFELAADNTATVVMVFLEAWGKR
jgi:adenosylhomocysteine nucleosidase